MQWAHVNELVGFFNQLVDEEMDMVHVLVTGDIFPSAVRTQGGQGMRYFLYSEQIVVGPVVCLSECLRGYLSMLMARMKVATTSTGMSYWLASLTKDT